MKSTVFPFGVVLKWILKFDIHSTKFELLSAVYPYYQLWNHSLCSVSETKIRAQMLCCHFLFLSFKILYEIYKEFLVYFVVRLIWQ